MRSKLFVPGSRPELFDKALASAADALSFDLEDAVVESRKQEARDQVEAFLDRHGDATKTIVVRTNPVGTEHFFRDVRSVARSGLDILNIPKVESEAEILETASQLDQLEAEFKVSTPIGILVNIESPKGLRKAADLAAASPRVVGLQIGYGDLYAPLGIDRRDTAAIHSVMFAVRMAAAEANVQAVDGAFTDVADLDGFAAEAAMARRLGFVGKSCVHPRQIEAANAIFRPSDEEIRHALKVVAMLRDPRYQGVGAFLVDGKMVDAPLFAKAQAIVKLARQAGLISEAA